MPLVVSALQSELVSIYTAGGDKGNPDPKKVGKDVGNGFWWKSICINAWQR
mgnify:CR=1 FL=1